MSKKNFILQSCFSFLITAFFFFGSGLFFYDQYLIKDIDLEVETEDTLLIRQVRNYKNEIDSLKGVLAVQYKRIDSVFIDNVVYDIPIIPYIFKDSIPIRINKERIYISFTLMIDGYVTEYSILTEEKKIIIDLKERKSLFSKRYIKTGIIVLGIATFYVLVLK